MKIDFGDAKRMDEEDEQEDEYGNTKLVEVELE
jgi:hypothetical protein